MSLLKNALKKNKYIHRWLRLKKREHLAKTDGYPDWDSIIGADRELWDDSLAKAKGGEKILIATSTAGHLGVTAIENMLGIALTLRKAEVHFLICDGDLPACMESQISWYVDEGKFAKHGPSKDLCLYCGGNAIEILQKLGFTVHRYGDHLSNEEKSALQQTAKSIPIEDIKGHTEDGIAIGEHARAGVLRFFAKGDIEDEPYYEPVMRRYFEAALISATVVRKMIRQYGFSKSVFHHGLYVPQGIVGEVARKENISVVNWNIGYRKKCFIFSHDNTYHLTILDEPTAKWENMQWTEETNRKIKEYLNSRWYGTQDWILFHDKPQIDPKLIEKETGIDLSKPCIGMLTNVIWDAQIHFPANAFKDVLDWTLETIAYFSEKRPDLQLLIRVHPAEIRGTLQSRQSILKEIAKRFPTLAKNIFIILPESNISTYIAMMQCDSVLIYGTKTGVELTSMGIPVIVGGEAWIRNKGISMDASSQEEYYQFLDKLPLGERLSKEIEERALRYAFHFFFRRMIPLDFVETSSDNPPFRIKAEGIDVFQPGNCQSLDIICDGILKGSDFIYPAEDIHDFKPSI